MNKRGDSQVDWAISLGIFLLYLAWFFIFIRPYMLQGEKPNAVSLVKENFENDALWTIEKVPIIVTSQSYLYREPIIADMTLKYNESNSFMQNNAFIINNNKLFFIGTVNLSNIFYLIHSNETYGMYNQITDLTATDQYATVTDFSADFENSILKSAFYFGTKIREFLLHVRDYPINATNISFSNKKIAAQYSITSQAANVTTYIFAYNPRVYMFFETNKSIYERFELDQYEGYFFDNSKYGTIHYPGACYEKTANQLVLYDNASNILFSFDRPVDFSLCTDNTSIRLEINFDSSAFEKLIFFRGDFMNYQNYIDNYNAEAGVKEELKLMSLANLQRLSLANYNDLKNSWAAPDFRIIVKNSSNNNIISAIGGTPYEKATVYAEESRNFLLDQFGNLQDASISIQSWT